MPVETRLKTFINTTQTWMDSSFDPVCILNKSHKIVYFNPLFYSMVHGFTRFSPKAIRECECFCRLIQTDICHSPCQIERVAESCIAYISGEVTARIENTSLPIMVRAVPIFDFEDRSQSTAIGTLIQIRDLTPFKEITAKYRLLLRSVIETISAGEEIRKLQPLTQKSAKIDERNPSDVQEALLILPKMDKDFLDPFISATIETMKVQCFVSPTPEKPFLKGRGPNIVTDLSAVIDLNSAHFRGSLCLSFPRRTFLGLMEKMLQEQGLEMGPHVKDGAAELLNIIFSNAKRTLNTKGYGIQNSIPIILENRGLKPDAAVLADQTGFSTVIVPFETEIGAFHLEISSQLEVHL